MSTARARSLAASADGGFDRTGALDRTGGIARVALVAVALLAVACQPYYRDDERRGRAARDPARAESLLRRADQAAARGEHRSAARLARAALDVDPRASTTVYQRVASHLTAAGDAVGARALLEHRASRPGGEGDPTLRDALVASYLAEDLVAPAITAAGVTTLDELFARDGFRAPLEDLMIARERAAGEPAAALAAYLRWLDAYGEPDHQLLRDAADDVVSALAGRVPALADLPARARAALDAGDLVRAALLAGLAHRALPGTPELRALLAAVAAAAREPAAIDPVAYQRALDADRALQRGAVGEALHLYRRAVAHAPWWPHARRNLAILLESVDESFGKGYQDAWLEALTPIRPD